jgi:1,4-alpha-glucan branching enzyme
MKLCSVLIILLYSAALAAQQAKPAQNAAPQMPTALITPEVHSDDSVTFRFRAPNAQEVSVRSEGVPDPLPMQKDESGVWTVNTAPLPPDY